MGLYTEHWNRYKQDSVRGTSRMLLLFVLGLPATALVAVGVQKLAGDYPVYLHIGLLAIWLVAFTALSVRYSRVTCPRCQARYSRGRWLVNCPKCDLRMLQDDP
ncbi:MAG: hypothetical protein EOP02_05555 [Proteobacteria bacterium]|nr:MAG: hypothetical protein EOP02_05555 [Pseudomonadota bacterium]